MRRLTLIAVIVYPGAALASDGLVAAECSALYEGHYQYEQANFDPADVSEDWRLMANDFGAAALGLGASQSDVDTALGRAAGWADAIEAQILGTDSELAAKVEQQQAQCDPLIETLPELPAHR